MLNLQRYAQQRILIGDDITIVVTQISPGLLGGRPYVKLGIEAPRDVAIHREEVYRKIQKERETTCES